MWHADIFVVSLELAVLFHYTKLVTPDFPIFRRRPNIPSSRIKPAIPTILVDNLYGVSKANASTK